MYIYIYIYIYVQMFPYVSRAFEHAFRAFELRGHLGSNMARKHCTCRASGHLGARKHRTCRALTTCSSPHARMGCSSPYSVAPECSKGLLEPLLGIPRVLERAVRAPARCPQGARRGCSSTSSVPPGRSKGLLKPAQCPRMLQVAVRAFGLYHRCAQSGISSHCP